MRLFIAFIIIFSSLDATAQDAASYLKDAEACDRQLKEKEAKGKYDTVLLADSTNIKALLRLTEINCAEGNRIIDRKTRKSYYTKALQYAQKMQDAYPDNADANYAIALVYTMLIDTDSDTKDVVIYVKLSHDYAARVLAIDPNHAKANYVLGKWNYDLLNVSLYKKAVMKTLYGKVPAANIDSAITYLEKAKSIQPYFVIDYFTLAKAYQLNNKPAKTIEVLNALIKLPNRTPDDSTMKAEARKMLDGEL